VKKNRIRGLRSAIGELFAEQSMLAIHEPALAALLGVLDGQSVLDIETLTSRLGMASGDEPTMRTIGNVAVLPIQGVISQKANWLTRALGWTASETLERDFLDAIGNSDVKAIAFYVDSPGGTALGNEETSRTMFANRGKKPVYAFVRGMCCSAAYYLASPAQQMFASPSSLVGSIGAVSTHIEYSKALAEMGIGATVIRSAPHKQLWNQFEKLSPEGKASLQKMVSDYGDQFEQAVARYRGISQAQVKAKYGQGDAFVAAEAAQRGLVDGVMSWSEFLAKVQGAVSAGPGPTAQLVVNRVSLADGTLAAGWPKQLEAEYARAAGESVQGLGQRADSFAPAIAASSSSPELSTPALQGEAVGGNLTSTSEITTVKISAKVRAALFARGLIQAQDADETICVAARDAYFAARGEACPQEDEKIVTALFATPAAAATATLASASRSRPARRPPQRTMCRRRTIGRWPRPRRRREG
jgi:signal peptide peptidase SppA